MSEPLASQRFGPTSGMFTGVLGLVVSAFLVGLAVWDGLSPGSVRFVVGVGISAVLIWAFMLRPRIILDPGRGSLLLRNPLVDVRIPLAAITVVSVRAVTTIKTGEDEYDSIAVGRPRRVMQPASGLGGDRWTGLPTSRAQVDQVPNTASIRGMAVHEVMTERILHSAEQARLDGRPTGAVERKPAVLELGALGLLVAALLVSLLV